jgi:hypothetical protein
MARRKCPEISRTRSDLVFDDLERARRVKFVCHPGLDHNRTVTLAIQLEHRLGLVEGLGTSTPAGPVEGYGHPPLPLGTPFEDGADRHPERLEGPQCFGRLGTISCAEPQRRSAVAKVRKQNVARKPPVPSDNHADIEDWIRHVMPDLQPIIKRLDELIRETIPGLQYAVKWKRPYYGLPELGWIIEMAAYDVSVNVVFFGGAEFDPPPPLGTTERTRYVKVNTLDEAEGTEMHQWIEQAGRVPGWT